MIALSHAIQMCIFGKVVIPRLVKRSGLCRITFAHCILPHEVWYERGQRGADVFASMYLPKQLDDIARYWDCVSGEPWYPRTII